MIRLLDKLNLSATERRLVVAVGLVLFVLLNLWLVRPHFRDWGKTKAELEKTRTALATYQTEVAKVPENELKLRKLEGQGASVLPANQATHLIRTIQTKGSQYRVNVTQTRQASTSQASKTNQFFEEQAIVINMDTGDKELVDFLYAIGTGSDMIRVRDLEVKPDPTGVRLVGSATLVASYQKAPTAADKGNTRTARTAAVAPPRPTSTGAKSSPTPKVATNAPVTVASPVTTSGTAPRPMPTATRPLTNATTPSLKAASAPTRVVTNSFSTNRTSSTRAVPFRNPPSNVQTPRTP